MRRQIVGSTIIFLVTPVTHGMPEPTGGILFIRNRGFGDNVHKDGGLLVAKTYGHLRDTHSMEMAKRMT